MSLKRLKSEFDNFINNSFNEVQLEQFIETDRNFIVLIKPDGLYKGEEYRLSMRLTNQFPFEPPIVVFTGPSPVHRHVFSNGHICLDILYRDKWSPALSLQMVALSVLSMLNSATEKRRPGDDAGYTQMVGNNTPALSASYFYNSNMYYLHCAFNKITPLLITIDAHRPKACRIACRGRMGHTCTLSCVESVAAWSAQRA